jgi:predicted transcriptional regulator
VVQGLDDFDKHTEECFVKAVAQGLADIREGKTVTLEQARKVLEVSKEPYSPEDEV